MSDNQYSFLNLKQNPNQEQLEDDIIEKELYKSKNQKIKQFEKFKPKKTKKDKIQNEKTLKGAENKLKSMISVFLLNLESEEVNLNKKYNSLFRDSIDDPKKQIKKINSIKKVKTNSIPNKNRPQSNFIKDDIFRISQKESNNNMNTNIRNKKSKPMSVNKAYYDLKNKKIYKKQTNMKDYISSTFSRRKSFNIDAIQKKKLISIGGENLIFNKKNSSTVSNKKIIDRISLKTLENKENQNINFKKLIKQEIKKTEDHDSLMTDNSNNSNSLLKKPFELRNSLNEESKLLKLNVNNNILSSFIIGDSSKTNIINNSQICGSLLPEDNLSIIHKKKPSIDIKDSSLSSVSIKRKRKCSIQKDINRRSTFYSVNQGNNIKNNCSNNKIFRHSTVFKSLKEALKQKIILRPDELQQNSKEITNKKISDKNIPKVRGKSKFASCLNTQKIDSYFNNIKIENNSIYPSTLTADEKNLEVENKNNENNKIKNDIEFSNNFTSAITQKNTKSYLNNKDKFRILIHKGAVYDSLDDEEIEEEYNFIYISPNSKFNIIFDGIMFFFSIISLIQVPLYLAKTYNFCKEKYLTLFSIFNIINEIFNAIDTFLGFFRAFYNFEEQLITKNSSIIKNYLKSWFIFDLLASIPIYSINKFQEEKCINFKPNNFYYDNILNNIHYLLIINRTLKVIKAFSLNQFYKIMSNHLIEYQFFNEYGNILVNIFLTTSALNFSACIYIFIARNSYPNWILQTNLHVKNFTDIYICSIYALMMAITTVGYGDITCYSFNERIFQLFLLIIGISAYSWLVSAFSNHIQKINEKYADFEKKKSILDEIKLKNPHLPEELYDRTLRYLKFKNFYDKKDKNLIFECLPVSLKNNLIIEMYKPIINNFLFFKNFQNTDFIIRVIFSFRPIIAIKNDILINEGEKVEDIIFVKKGILSLEIPINTENPQKNIYKYLNDSTFKIEKESYLKKAGNNIIAGLGKRKSKTSILDKINSINNIKRNSVDNKKEKKENNFNSYVRILCIRENEHFGDVLMFLGQRSFLRVRVRSKRAELFFLRKIDAIKISSSYKNIWRRINKKSLYNYEQVKKSIKKIIELYCSIKFKNEEDTFISIPKKRKTSINTLKSSAYSLQPQKSNNYIDLHLKKSNSDKNIRAKYLNNNFFPILDKNITTNDENSQSTKNNNKLNKNSCQYFSFKNDGSDNDSSSSISLSSDYEVKSKTKLIDTYNGKYKNYKSSEFNNKTEKNSIITEEIGREESLSQHRTGIGKMYSCKKDNKKYKLNELMDNCSFNIKKNKSLSVTQKFSNNSIISKIKPEYFSNFNENISKKKKKNSNISIYELEVNDEIYPGEEFKINLQNSLIPFKTENDVSSKYNYINLREDKNNSNNNLKKLLDDIKSSFVSDNKNNAPINNINNNFNCYCQFCQNHNQEKILIDNLKNNNKPNMNEQKILMTNLTIDSTINIEYDSLYENLNTLNSKITTDKELQQKIKNLLKNYSAVYPKNSSLKISNLEKNYQKGNNELHTLKNDSLKFTLSFAANQKNSKLENNNSFFNKRSVTFKNLPKKSVNRSLSTRSKIKAKLQFGLSRQKSINRKVLSAKKCNLLAREGTIKYNNIKTNTITLTPQKSGKKKISNLLSQINFNIEKTNENLNHPDEFYSNYFQTLLGTDKIKEKKPKRKSCLIVRSSRIETLKSKKEKKQKVA